MQDHDKSGIYKLTCKTCNRAYIGQTSGNLTLRYCEHIRYIKKTTIPSPLMHCTSCKTYMNMVPFKDTMSLLKPIHKTSMLIPYEQLLIQTFHHNRNLILEQNCAEQNPLFLLATDYSLT